MCACSRLAPLALFAPRAQPVGGERGARRGHCSSAARPRRCGEGSSRSLPALAAVPASRSFVACRCALRQPPGGPAPAPPRLAPRPAPPRAAVSPGQTRPSRSAELGAQRWLGQRAGGGAGGRPALDRYGGPAARVEHGG